jgi:hypothetical protein
MYLEVNFQELETVNLTEEGFVSETSVSDDAVGDAASDAANG